MSVFGIDSNRKVNIAEQCRFNPSAADSQLRLIAVELDSCPDKSDMRWFDS